MGFAAGPHRKTNNLWRLNSPPAVITVIKCNPLILTHPCKNSAFCFWCKLSSCVEEYAIWHLAMSVNADFHVCRDFRSICHLPFNTQTSVGISFWLQSTKHWSDGSVGCDSREATMCMTEIAQRILLLYDPWVQNNKGREFFKRWT